jgi:Cys-tRNA(Pro) deacylase
MDDLQTFLDKAGTDAQILTMDVPMPTAPAAAEALKVPVGCIFKSLLLTGDGKYILLVLSGEKRVDTKKAAELVGASRLKLADKDVVLEQTGYSVGSVPPVGHKSRIPVIVDQSLMDYEFGYGGGGRHECLIKIRPKEIVRLTGATIAAISL